MGALTGRPFPIPRWPSLPWAIVRSRGLTEGRHCMRLTVRHRTLAVLAASALALGGLGAPAATAQQLLFPGSSFGLTFGDVSAPAALDPAGEEYREQLIEATNAARAAHDRPPLAVDRKSTRLNSSHVAISYAVFCLNKKK